MNKEKVTAIVLAAGRGKRMGTDVPKQYILIDDRPVLYYTLKVFQESPDVDEIILVCGGDETDYCRHEIVERYRFGKVSTVIEGGKERYDSVWRGLKSIQACDYVLIHDGARPFADQAMIERNLAAVRACGACVTGMPVKDTIRICDEKGNVTDTPDRKCVWQIQTPQTFRFSLIVDSYRKMFETGKTEGITDDAMVAERFGGCTVRMVEGSYRNMKLSSPEDLDWMRLHMMKT